MEYCKYCKYINKGIEQYLNCSLSGKYCIKQKFCRKANKVIHIDGWEDCSILKKDSQKQK